MGKIVGIASPRPLNLKKQGDLLFHEGPLLSHFVDEKDAKSHYLYKWADCDDQVNRWLVAAVTENILLDYLSKSVSLLKLLSYSTKLYVSDIDEALIEVALAECSFENIPSSCLPGQQSYFDESSCEDYALTLKANILAGRALDYSLAAEWLDHTQIRQASGPEEQLSVLSHEIFDTLLNGYSKKKVFGFFAKHSSLQASQLPIDHGYLLGRDTSHVGKHFVIFVQFKQHSTASNPAGWMAALDSLRMHRGINTNLRDLDAVLLRRTHGNNEEFTLGSDMTALLRSYVYDQYQSALEEDNMVENFS